MKKIRILGIAPYQGLKELMESAAASRTDLELTVYLGDLSDGAALVGQVQDQGFDVIISRGGTARMIESIAHVPVVEIMLSGYDMLRAIRLARSYDGRFAIVGFPGITGCAQLICDLIQYRTDIFTIHNSGEATRCIHSLASQGYSLIVGDAVTISQSRQMGLNGILITSGTESIDAALDQAVKLCRTIGQRDSRHRLLEGVLAKCAEYVAVYDREGSLVYENTPASLPAPKAELHAYLPKQIPSVLASGNLTVSRRFGDNFCHIRGSIVGEASAAFASFFVHRAFGVPAGDEGWLIVKNPLEEATRSFNTFYNNSRSMEAFTLQAKRFSETELPVLILGERGAGKDTIAYTMHANSPLGKSPFVILDCARISPKKWDLLLDSSESPLCLSGHGILLKNLQALGDGAKTRLVRYLEASSVHRRNRLFFSWSILSKNPPEADPLMDHLLGALGCLTLTVPSLFERRDDIPSLASVLMGELNLRLGKQVIGLDSGALALLQQFRWEGNLEQFRAVMTQLVLLADGPTVTAATARLVLDQQRPLPSAGADGIILDGTLDEIIDSVIRTVLAQEGNNQSRTAARLGISRGTLWRRLKAIEF